MIGVRRQKSIAQIREQMARLLNATRDVDATSSEERRNKQSRFGRIVEIGSRYVRNIAQSKRFANDIYQGRGLDVARGRTYSQNTYMGYNNG